MTDTLISLISIFIGILGANVFGWRFKHYSLGMVGNTIAGVFGSILFIKLFGRLGFDPKSIMEGGSVDVVLFVVNSAVSFLAGGLAVVGGSKLKARMNRGNE